MKKLIVIITILLAALVGFLPASDAAEHVTNTFERWGIALGIGVAGFIPVAIIAIREFIVHRLGGNVAQNVLAKLEANSDEVEQLASLFMQTSTAKQLVADKQAHLAEQVENHKQWHVELLLALNDLVRKLPLFDGEERTSAENDVIRLKQRIREIEAWLDENTA